jgi:hypothetical protein
MKSRESAPIRFSRPVGPRRTSRFQPSNPKRILAAICSSLLLLGAQSRKIRQKTPAEALITEEKKPSPRDEFMPFSGILRNRQKTNMLRMN